MNSDFPQLNTLIGIDSPGQKHIQRKKKGIASPGEGIIRVGESFCQCLNLPLVRKHKNLSIAPI